MADPIDRLAVGAFEVPTDQPHESDGTLEWDSTTLVLVEVSAGGRTGLGYTYSHAAAARLIDGKLRGLVEGGDPLAVGALWERMHVAVRNLGQTGLGAQALSAVDNALWDLKARLLGVSLVDLLGPVREAVDVYGSGGFTSYGVDQLREQLSGWVERGIPRVKMKVGREPSEDVSRVAAARRAIGPEAELFVDANGAYDRKQAVDKAYQFADYGVRWFEEPVSSDDLEGLRLVRDTAPPGMEITSGEYGWSVFDFRRLLDAGAVDVLQPDATRCGGLTGFSRAVELCRARSLPASAHTAPSLHTHVCCARVRCATSSTSTTTCGSRRCSSTAARSWSAERCARTAPRRATA